MKKILSIILLVCSSYLLRAQFSITQNLGSPNTLVKNPNYGGFQGGLIPFTFADTTAANLTNLKYYAGAYIYTSSPRATWWRDAAVSQWIQVLPGGGTGALGAWTTTLNTTIPTDLSLNGYFGTTDANGIGFYTTNTQRVILPAGGLTLKAVVSDTTLNKPMVWNTSTKEWNYAYWYGGSGATPTWQQTLTAGSTLTGGNVINGGGFDFEFGTMGNFTVESTNGNIEFTDLVGNNLDIRGSLGINLNPYTGLLYIDTLTNLSTQDELLGRKNSTGQVGYITVGSGLSLSGGALSATATTPTWQQTLTAGSTLTGDNTVNGGGFDIEFGDFNNFEVSINSAANSHILLDGNGYSQIYVKPDSIFFNPHLGNIHIDTLNNASTQNQLMGWTSSGGDRGGVGYITVGSGLSLSSGALSASVTASSTTTFINKRWTARVGSTTSSATPTINTDNYDIYKLTAQTADITSMTTNLSGTPVDGDILEVQITGTAARAITWGASFVSSTVTLPTTTVTTATLTVILQYYSTSSYGNNKWVCVNYY